MVVSNLLVLTPIKVNSLEILRDGSTGREWLKRCQESRRKAGDRCTQVVDVLCLVEARGSQDVVYRIRPPTP